MRILSISRLLTAIPVLIVAFCFSVNAATPPISVKVAEAPQFLVAGQSHVFVIEVQSTSDEPFTFSLLPGFVSPTFCWREYQKVGLGAAGCFSGSGGSTSACTSYTGYDPETGEITCKTLCYKPSDFVTLQPKESRRFEVDVYAPEIILAKRATATVSFELSSESDGKDLGLAAWTGKIEFNYELPIVQVKARGK